MLAADQLVTDAARRVFGENFDRASRYAAALSTVAIERGLLGPREAERVWERHVLNGAVLASLPLPAAHLVDLGSGAGLPGIDRKSVV